MQDHCLSTAYPAYHAHFIKSCVLMKCILLQEAWSGLMVQYMRRNAERHANMSVVAPTTPAQLFHVLRRQAGLHLQALS